MPTFDEDVEETIERCRRLVKSTLDMEMASKLLKMAEDMKKCSNTLGARGVWRNPTGLGRR